MGGSAGLSRRPVAAAPAVGVDETSFQRRHEYVTVILPANLSIDDSRVRFELTRYLPDNWVPVPSRDVDGQRDLPLRLDAEVANLGKFSASQVGHRVAASAHPPIRLAAAIVRRCTQLDRSTTWRRPFSTA